MDITIELIANNKRVTLSKIIGGCFLTARKNIVPPFYFCQNPPFVFRQRCVKKYLFFAVQLTLLEVPVVVCISRTVKLTLGEAF